MKFFLDTANIDEIKKGLAWGIVSGVTTNPTLVSRESGCNFHDRVKEIAGLVGEHVSAEAVGTDAETLVREGRILAAIHPAVVVKLPICPYGLAAANTLSREGISTNVTLVFSVQQALLAAAAGATFVSPFVGRLEDIGMDGIELVKNISDVFRLHGINAKIIAASLRNPYHVQAAAMAGAHIATVPYKAMEQLFDHHLTTAGINRFNADWEAYRNNNG